MATSAARRHAPATSSLAGSGRLQRCAPRKLVPWPFGRFSDPIRSDQIVRAAPVPGGMAVAAGRLRLFGCGGRTVAGSSSSCRLDPCLQTAMQAGVVKFRGLDSTTGVGGCIILSELNPVSVPLSLST
jgi:hypothetical protein